jgi:putative FmdB family regulatory protein
MPIYEYRCRECGSFFEKLRRMKDADAEIECPYCESNAVQRQMSTFATSSCGGTGKRGFT